MTKTNWDNICIPVVKPSLGLHILSLIEGGCSVPNGISEQWKHKIPFMRCIHRRMQCSGLQYKYRSPETYNIMDHSCSQRLMQCNVHNTQFTLSCKTMYLCCELLTWSVTGTEPDQVFLCQGAAELSRVQGAGHQCASTINYRSMRCDSIGSAMLTAKEGELRHWVIIV